MTERIACHSCGTAFRTWAAAYACRCDNASRDDFRRQQAAEMRAEQAMDDRYAGTSD